MKLLRVLCFSIIILVTSLSIAGKKSASKKSKDPYVFLTWTQENTSENMTVVYKSASTLKSNKIYYDTVSRAGDTRLYRHSMSGNSHKISTVPGEVHRIELTQLKPRTDYFFVVPKDSGGYSKEMKFRTVPDSGDIRFITGGDMTSTGFDEVNEHIVKLDPHFAVIGGDIAYANGRLSNWRKWEQWLKTWTKSMISPDGRIIPFISAIGNHETNYTTIKPKDKAPFYFGLFGQDAGTYFLRKFGDRIAFLVLDSGHISKHNGDQAKWLESTLEANKDVPAKFAVYHVPMYPSHRSPNGGQSVAGRKYWIPIFDKFELTTGFENHDHIMKRTKPLRANKEVKNINDGTIYLGDGCWGKGPRTVRKEWYLEKAIAKQHAWFVEVKGDIVNYKAIDNKGKVLDQVSKSIQ